MTSSTNTGHENPGTVVGAGRALSEGSTTVTMSGAPTVVSMIWGVLSTVADGTSYGPMIKHKAVALLLALIVGLILYWQGNDAKAHQTFREKVGGVLLALVNSFMIAAAALGINSLSMK